MRAPRPLPPPALVPAASIVAEPTVDRAGRAAIALTLVGPRDSLVFVFDLAQAATFAAHLAATVGVLLAAPPALAALDTPAGPHLIREA